MNKVRFDLLIIVPVIAILTLGLITLSSALSYNPSKFYVQLLWVAIGTVLFIITSIRHRRNWENVAVLLYAANIILLILVLAIGKKIGGAYRWLDLGFMNFQPSELTKLSIILFIAARLNQKPIFQDGYKVRDLIIEVLAVAASMYLIYREPDLGTALLVGITSFIMLISAKINKKRLLWGALILAVAAPLIWEFALIPYQKTRITAIVTMIFSDSPEKSRTSQYHTIQSTIAVGSGQLDGKGYKQGTQNMLRFIPEHHTDFIFSVYAEEFGFAGVMILFLLYFLLFFRMIKLIPHVHDKFSALVIIGTVSLIWIQFFVNIGMVSGMLPVVGIPLPFFSYGGSSLMINSILLGLVHNFSLNSRYSAYK